MPLVVQLIRQLQVAGFTKLRSHLLVPNFGKCRFPALEKPIIDHKDTK